MNNNLSFNDIIAPVAEALGFEYLGCEFFPAPKACLRIYIDSSAGITVDDCEKVSRQVSAVLDVEDPISGEYSLEVSSPGLDRPLFTLDQCRRFVGSRIKIRLRAPLEGRRNFSGILQEVLTDTIGLEVEEELIYFKYLDIEKARLVME